MKCDKIRELLSLYIDQMLDENQIKQVEEHLAVCAACNKEYDDLKEITELLGQVETVSVPESFEFRLKKALKEEKQSRSAGDESKEKTSKKGKWRILTSIAAVFAVGVISFGLYHDVLGILPDKLNSGDQAAAVKVKQADDLYGAKAPAPEDSDKVDPSIAMKDQSSELQSKKQSTDNESIKVQSNAKDSQNKNTVSNNASAAAPEDSPEILFGLADGTESDTGAGLADDTAEQPQDLGGVSDYRDAATNKKECPQTECSRSLNASGVERNVAAVHYYDNLIEEKLDGFDYQILDSNYIQNGEWNFRVFIFRGKDGNTYNEEIMIVGKDGEIKVICSNEFMGL